MSKQTKGNVDPLGDRMKRYEKATRTVVTPRTPVIIRVDGKSFHTYTRELKDPFDRRLSDAMERAAVKMCEGIQGAQCAYTQSDEISVVLTPGLSFFQRLKSATTSCGDSRTAYETACNRSRESTSATSSATARTRPSSRSFSRTPGTHGKSWETVGGTECGSSETSTATKTTTYGLDGWHSTPFQRSRRAGGASTATWKRRIECPMTSIREGGGQLQKRP